MSNLSIDCVKHPENFVEFDIIDGFVMCNIHEKAADVPCCEIRIDKQGAIDLRFLLDLYILSQNFDFYVQSDTTGNWLKVDKYLYDGYSGVKKQMVKGFKP